MYKVIYSNYLERLFSASPVASPIRHCSSGKTPLLVRPIAAWRSAFTGGLCGILTWIVLLMLVTTSVRAERAALVVDIDSTKVLYASNVNLPSYPASLVKLMTIYLLLYDIELGKLSMQDQLSISTYAQSQPSSKLGLKAGDVISVENALLGLIVRSANDVAIVAAEAISGSESQFVKRMNTLAEFLGMKNTVFKNASGLPDAEQITTARDMAALGLAIFQRFPEHIHLFARRTFTYKKRTYKTHNRFMLNYPGANGLKTGYTCHSGYNLLGSVSLEGKRLIGVVLGEKTRKARDGLMTKLIDEALANQNERSSILSLGEIRYYSDQGSKDIVNSDVLARGCRSRKLLPVKQVLLSTE